MATQLKQIVELLNAEPFGMELSLVQFDEKDGTDLLEVLRKVLGYLDAKQDVEDVGGFLSGRQAECGGRRRFFGCLDAKSRTWRT